MSFRSYKRPEGSVEINVFGDEKAIGKKIVIQRSFPIEKLPRA